MIKISSLEFVNKDFYETDVYTAEGELLCKKGSEIDPNTLLRLYFKEIYVKEPLTGNAKTSRVESVIDDIDFSEDKSDENIESVETAETNVVSTEEKAVEEVPVEEVPVEEVPVEEIVVDSKAGEVKLEFDEQEAQRISELSEKIGKELKLSSKVIKELKEAAYYHNIGRTNLTQNDLFQPDFRKKQAMEGFNILLNEKKMPLKIAEAAKFYIQKYETSSPKKGEEIQYSHIVAIASYYDSYIQKNIPKEKILDKMLQLGGNRFNIFVLHKFIRMMKED